MAISHSQVEIIVVQGTGVRVSLPGGSGLWGEGPDVEKALADLSAKMVKLSQAEQPDELQGGYPAMPEETKMLPDAGIPLDPPDMS